MGLVRDTLELFNLTNAPSTPATGRSKIYVKDNGLWMKNDLGVERGLLTPDSAIHSNPDFEGSGAAPGINWSNFWGQGGTWSYDTTTAIQGSRSIKNVSTSGAGPDIRIGNSSGMGAAGQLTPGSTIQISIWAKHSVAAKNLEMAIITATPAGAAEFFGAGSTLQGANRTMSSTWARYEASFVVPSGHTKGQIFFSVAKDGELWFDASGSKITAQPPPSLNEDWIDYPTLSTPNIPMSINRSRIRRVNNNVQINANITLTGVLQGPCLIDIPYPFATGTVKNASTLHGRVRAIRAGVAWYQGDITPMVYSIDRWGIFQPTGSGAQWTVGSPAAFTTGDTWAIDIEYECSPA